MTSWVLPRPRKVLQRKGRFDITRDTPVILSPSCDGSDRFAAGLLREEIADSSSVELSVEKHGRVEGLGKYILLLRLADAKEGRAKGEFPSLTGAGQAARIGDEGYLIEITPQRVVVAANAGAGLYYGVQTLRQSLDARPGKAGLQAMSITDYPDFRYRGVMLDVCRGKVPTLQTLYGLVQYLASVKVNCLQFHMEHTFAFHRHPDIGRGKGAFTAEEVMELKEYAARHHVEFQANLQSFGHMSNILSITRYRDLAESPGRPWSVSPGRRETYEFLDDLYSEYLPCFDADVFNANCDEVWDLGEGRSKKLVEKRGAGRVYADHMKKVRSLARKYGKRLAMWADYCLKYPETLRLLPKDVILINWGYTARHDFGSSAKIRRAGFEHWVAPGTNSWSALFPRLDVACSNIAGAAAAGRKHGATGLLNTDWGDGGHPNMLGASYHGFAFGAEAAWSGASRDAADFDRRFTWVLARDRSGLLGKIFRALGATNAAFGAENYKSVPFQLYWAEFPDGIKKSDVKEAALKRAQRAAWKARNLIGIARQTLPGERLLLTELDFAARQTIFACDKARLAVLIQKEMPRGAGEAAAGFGGRALPREVATEVGSLLRDWRLHRDEFERLWLARSRPSEIEQRLRLYRTREQEFARLAAQADARLRQETGPA